MNEQEIMTAESVVEAAAESVVTDPSNWSKRLIKGGLIAVITVAVITGGKKIYDKHKAKKEQADESAPELEVVDSEDEEKTE